MNVYLAGTITPEERHLEWRRTLCRLLAHEGHAGVSPLRYQNKATFVGDGLHDSNVPDKFFVNADIADVLRSDLMILVYWRDNRAGTDVSTRGGILLPPPFDPSKHYRRQSIGTWCEFMLAVSNDIPVIVVTDDPDVFDHPFIKVKAAYICTRVDEGWEMVKKYLSGPSSGVLE